MVWGLGGRGKWVVLGKEGDGTSTLYGSCVWLLGCGFGYGLICIKCPGTDLLDQLLRCSTSDGASSMTLDVAPPSLF